jgi:predicted ATPase/tetratricopeptide (TPR) repeat protein/transcriptional regulator with XRE-family HTH domain
VSEAAVSGQDRARTRLVEARESIRRERGEVMSKMGRQLYEWRQRSGIKQQDLAAEGCVSATVVRRIEKGDYESAPHPSLVTAVGRLGGPSGEFQALVQTYRALQARQRHVDNLLQRKEVPDSAGWLDSKGKQPQLAAGLRPATLPRSSSLFVGRREDLSGLARLLDTQRLVTVVGPGGIGKTALCLRFAESRSFSPAGPWFADLSRIRVGEPVLPVLADLILQEAGGTGDDAELVATLGAILADTPALIILDNCEHVIASAAVAVTRMLTVCPGVRVVATSREPLHLPGEWVMTVEPLPVAKRGSEPGDAVELFIRLLGQARGEEPALSPGQVAEITELCRALDGVPLCIELAAARARTLPVSDIAASVRRGLAILSGGRREVPRHEAIEATISWSWNLLEPHEQRALSRLAILTVPFTFRCGAVVAHDDLEHGERLLATLADKSLVSREMDESRDPRFKILGVVRNFAIRQLDPDGLHHATRRLMYWALNFIYPNEPEFQQPDTVERLDTEFALLRIALEGNEQWPADQVRLAAGIWPYWQIRSLSQYGCRFLAKAQHEETQLTLAERGRALGILANLLVYQGRDPESVDAAQQGVQVLRDLGDRAQLRHGLLTLLGCLIEAGRFDQADRCLTELAAIPGPIELSTVGDLNVRQGLLYLHRGDPHQAIRLLTGAVRCFSSESRTLAQGFSLGYLSVAQRRAGDLDASLRTALEARELLGGMFGPSYQAEVTVSLAAAYLALGRYEDALGALDGIAVDEEIRPQTRVHSLVLRAMAASAAAPSAAAAFLLSHASEFASGSGEQTVLFIRATQEVSYRSEAYENSALLLGIAMRLGSAAGDVEVGLPPFTSARLQRHLPPPVLEALIGDGFDTDPGAAFRLAITALTELAADRRVPLPQRSTLGASLTFGTRLMLIAPHSPASP